MAKIKWDVIAVASRNLRTLVTLNGMLLTHKLYILFMFTNEFILCCLLSYSLYFYGNNIEKFANVCYVLVLSLDVMILHVIGTIWKITIHNIVNDTHYTYDYQSAIMRMKIDEIEEERAIALKGFANEIIFVMCFLSFLQTVMAYFQANLINGEPFLLFPCWFPFEINNVFLQVLVLLWEEMLLFNIHFMAFGTLGFMYTTYSHIKAEVSVIKYAMRNIGPRAVEMVRSHKDFSEENLKSVNDRNLSRFYYICTRMCAQHHSEILEYFSNTSYHMGIMYTIAFCSGVITSSFAGYFIISDNFALKSKFMGMAIAEFALIYAMFWSGDGVTTNFLSISETVYTMEWYNLPKNCQSTLRLMQLKSNKPMFFMMLLGQQVDMEAYMAFVKASYYYINLMIAK